MKVIEHFADVWVASAIFDDADAVLVGTPLDHFDADMANAPLIHGGARGFVEIDGISADEGAAVVIDLIEDTGLFGDAEEGAFGIARPIGGGAADVTEAERGADRAELAIDEVIGFVVGVGRGANGAEGGGVAEKGRDAGDGGFGRGGDSGWPGGFDQVEVASDQFGLEGSRGGEGGANLIVPAGFDGFEFLGDLPQGAGGEGAGSHG